MSWRKVLQHHIFDYHTIKLKRQFWNELNVLTKTSELPASWLKVFWVHLTICLMASMKGLLRPQCKTNPALKFWHVQKKNYSYFRPVAWLSGVVCLTSESKAQMMFSTSLLPVRAAFCSLSLQTAGSMHACTSIWIVYVCVQTMCLDVCSLLQKCCSLCAAATITH